MTLMTEAKYSFISTAMPGDTFGVVRFSGREGLSSLYRFEIDLVSHDHEVDMAEVLQSPASFVIKREAGDVPFRGVVAEMEQLDAVAGHAFYRTVLVPRLAWLSLRRHSQVFLDMTVPAIIEAVLRDGGLAEGDYELRLAGKHEPREYVCQYAESHLDFISRWMEREGMYFFFEQGEYREKLVITDTMAAHSPSPLGGSGRYVPDAGLDAGRDEEVVRSLALRQVMLPGRVRVRDYNFRTPSLDVSGMAEASPDGRGEVYHFGDHVLNPEEGGRMARVRAEEHLCRERVFRGSSTLPFASPGRLVRIERHGRDDFNRAYLVTEAEHEGCQARYLTAGLKEAVDCTGPLYGNSFRAVPDDVQYRSLRTTRWPRINSTLSARVDAAGSGKYAELDDHGRYKIVLPFDLSSREGGKASAWVRMMQPYGGPGHGMHFPLHKGAEVLLTFIDGDPDRPVIAGAVPNPLCKSPVAAGSETGNVIHTAGGNQVHLEDMAGKQAIRLSSPTANTSVTLGSINKSLGAGSSPEGWQEKVKEALDAYMEGKGEEIKEELKKEWEEEGKEKAKEALDEYLESEEGGVHISTLDEFKAEAKSWTVEVGTWKNEVIIGAENTFIGGGSNEVIAGEEFCCTLGVTSYNYITGLIDFCLGFNLGVCLGTKTEYHFPSKWTFGNEEGEMHAFKHSLAGMVTDLVESHNKLAGQTTFLAADVKKVAGIEQKLAAEVKELATVTTFMGANMEILAGEMQEVKGGEESVVGDQVRMIAQRANTIGENAETIGKSTIMAVLESQCIETSTKMCNTTTTVASVHNLL